MSTVLIGPHHGTNMDFDCESDDDSSLPELIFRSRFDHMPDDSSSDDSDSDDSLSDDSIFDDSDSDDSSFDSLPGLIRRPQYDSDDDSIPDDSTSDDSSFSSSLPKLMRRSQWDSDDSVTDEADSEDNDSLGGLDGTNSVPMKRDESHRDGIRANVTQVKATSMRYKVTAHISRNKNGSLVDRGANGGIIGSDAIVMHQHQRVVDVTGIDNHELPSLHIVDAYGKTTTQHGPVIVIMKQYAYYGTGRTIHSSGQMEHYENIVYDRSMKVGGTQCIRTNEGYIIPLDIVKGLPYMPLEPATDEEFHALPHVILTSGHAWDPTVLDNRISHLPDWYTTLHDYNKGLINTPFDEYGRYRNRTVPGNDDPPDPKEDTKGVNNNVHQVADEGSATSDTESESSDEEDPLQNLRVTFLSMSDLNLPMYIPEDSESFPSDSEADCDAYVMTRSQDRKARGLKDNTPDYSEGVRRRKSKPAPDVEVEIPLQLPDVQLDVLPSIDEEEEETTLD